MAKYRQYTCNTTEVTVVSIIVMLGVVGILLNFQNLWEYWPESGKFADVPMQWIISIIGVFIPPIGMFTGWIF